MVISEGNPPVKWMVCKIDEINVRRQTIVLINIELLLSGLLATHFTEFESKYRYSFTIRDEQSELQVAGMSKWLHPHWKVDAITYPSPNFTDCLNKQTLKLWHGWVITSQFHQLIAWALYY